jgi:hypothetical protein
MAMVIGGLWIVSPLRGGTALAGSAGAVPQNGAMAQVDEIV